MVVGRGICPAEKGTPGEEELSEADLSEKVGNFVAVIREYAFETDAVLIL